MSEVDPVCLRNQTKQLSVAVETPRTTHFDDFEGGLTIPVKEQDVWFPGGVFVGKLDCRCAVPLDVNYGNEAIGQDSLNCRAARESFELGHRRAAPL